MEIQINFVFTEEAAALMQAYQPEPMSWPSPDIGTTPIQGDLLSFGADEDAPMFIVENRLFIWKSTELLVVQPLLGVWSRSAEDPATP